jgi:hypothetical protein
MNRGYDGNDIFAGNKNKARFLDFLEGTAKKVKFCVSTNFISKYEKEKDRGLKNTH